MNGARRSVESGEEAVAQRLNLAAETGELLTHRMILRHEQLAPGSVTHRLGTHG